MLTGYTRNFGFTAAFIVKTVSISLWKSVTDWFKSCWMPPKITLVIGAFWYYCIVLGFLPRVPNRCTRNERVLPLYYESSVPLCWSPQRCSYSNSWTIVRVAETAEKKRRGTAKHDAESYFVELMWRRMIGHENPFQNIPDTIKETWLPEVAMFTYSQQVNFHDL